MAAEMLPALPASTVKLWRELRSRRAADLHPGLQLDKYLPIVKPPSGKNSDDIATRLQEDVQRPALELVCKTSGDQVLLDSLLQRRQALFDDLHRGDFAVTRFAAVTATPLTLHLARGAALENAGICLHPLYGFVFLPGSGLKGMTRAYAETVWAAGEADKAEAWQKIRAVFGWAPHSEDRKPWKPRQAEVPNGAGSGAIVFHDAWPLRWPRLALDIVNNHHSAYYSAGDKDKVPPPGDWENPSPVTFLAVDAGQTFDFALAKRDRKVSGELLELAAQWLMDALTVMGVGAKTAAGYGAFRIDDSSVGVKPPAAPAQTRISETFTLELLTPAFIAGARQQKEDCELRSATLRGLLRWWWRTMHAAHVDPATLRRLESTVWGNTEASGALRVTVQASGQLPKPYRCKERYKQGDRWRVRPLDSFLEEHGLAATQAQGLFYLSYGMYEPTSTDDPEPRWYLEPGARWQVTLSARDSHYPGANRSETGKLHPNYILAQGRAALWLLCHFGGIGSKSRKGFGCLAEPFESSVSQCVETARTFRERCGIPGSPGRSGSPALDDRLEAQLPLRSSDCWQTLDTLGRNVQKFARDRAHDASKLRLGLPRQIHGPRERPLRHQDPKRHQPPLKLTGPQGDRHAAPILYHLARNADGSFFVRVAAFPAARLPNAEQSRAMLSELLDHLKQTLSKSASSTLASPTPQSPGPATQRSAQPVPNLYAPSTPRGQRKGGKPRNGPKRR